MSQTTTKLPLARANRVAQALVDDLDKGCERIEVAGSIRRQCQEIGDIELVCIPATQSDLFGGNAGSLLDGLLERLCRLGSLKRIKGGERYKQFSIPHAGTRLDMFIVTTETWGCQLVIRTGPAEFSHRLVTAKAIGGLCPGHLRFREGRLWQGEVALRTPEERDVFLALGLPWVEAKDRR